MMRKSFIDAYIMTLITTKVVDFWVTLINIFHSVASIGIWVSLYREY